MSQYTRNRIISLHKASNLVVNIYSEDSRNMKPDKQ